ncbi:transmembrane protein 268 isoform X2 [Pseudonaja textilis]|uniref:transmembrane protein 268 isoform X2 n=1 Tax=Pseudonaja textilis TaxID=8673 RepID=UPI000EAAA914|nr:transmembrane protein 268 isoform X2 [Pseudonaja textilis]
MTGAEPVGIFKEERLDTDNSLLGELRAEHLFKMLCGGDKGGEEEEGLPVSITYCWNKGKKHLDFWRNDFLNGQVFMVLTAHKPRGCPPVIMNSWQEKLKTLGIEVTEDQWETLIQQAVLEPEMRTYLLYNSRGIRMGIAAIVYVILWINLYSVLQIFSVGQSWKISVLVTLVALVAAVAILVIIHHDQSKMNVNTDMRLIAANEAFMKLGFLVGMTNIPDKNSAVPQSALKRNLEDVGIVVETAILPTWESPRNDSLEECLLLPETKKKSSNHFLSRREFLHLVPDRTPETMAQQLLMVFSSYYVRLLVSGQLPEVHAEQHKTVGHRPCLCQFVKTTLLGKEFFGLQQRWTLC